MSLKLKTTQSLQNLKNFYYAHFTEYGKFDTAENIKTLLFKKIDDLYNVAESISERPLDGKLKSKLDECAFNLDSTLSMLYNMGGEFGRMVANKQIRGYFVPCHNLVKNSGDVFKREYSDGLYGWRGAPAASEVRTIAEKRRRIGLDIMQHMMNMRSMINAVINTNEKNNRRQAEFVQRYQMYKSIIDPMNENHLM
jgi:hypothetical protein